MQPSTESERGEMLRGAEAYWRELRGRRRLPLRRDVRAEGLGAARPHSFLLQRVSPGEAILRSAGTALKDFAQCDPRGLPLSVLFAPTSRPELARLTVQLFQPAIIDAPLLLPRRLARPRAAGRMMLLPLVGDDGLASAALGVLVVSADTSASSRLLSLGPPETIRRDPLSGLTLATEATLSFETLPERIGQPALRLVVDNAQPRGRDDGKHPSGE